MKSSVAGHHLGAVWQTLAMSHMLWPTVYSANETWTFSLKEKSPWCRAVGGREQPRSYKPASGSRPLGL